MLSVGFKTHKKSILPGLCPDPTGEAYTAVPYPYPVAGAERS